jgi:hypothetical protein
MTKTSKQVKASQRAYWRARVAQLRAAAENPKLSHAQHDKAIADLAQAHEELGRVRPRRSAQTTKKKKKSKR